MATVGISASYPPDLKKVDAPTVTIDEVKPVVTVPVQFKLVKVKKPDGTIITVKRPITQDPKKALPAGTTEKTAVPKPDVQAQAKTASPAPKSTTATSDVQELKASEAPKGGASPVPSGDAKALTSDSAIKLTPQKVPSALVSSPKKDPVPEAPVSNPVKTSTQLPAARKSKAVPVSASAPAKKKWYSGLSKGISNLNVDKIASTLDSIEYTTTRIDAALSGKSIPPKKAAAAPSTVSAPKPEISSPAAPKATTVVLKTNDPKPASTGAPAATTILVASQQASVKKDAQVHGSTQPVVIIAKESNVPAKAISASPAAKPQAPSSTVVKTLPVAVPSSTSTKTTPQVQPVAQAAKPQASPVTVAKTAPVSKPSVAPAKTTATIAHAPVRAVDQTSKATPSTTHSATPGVLPASVGAASAIGTTTVHATEKPVSSHAPTTTNRSISDAPTVPQHNTYPAYNPTQYPAAQSSYQTGSTVDSGADYTGLAEGAIGGAAMGVGGGLAYDEYEDYQSGDEAVDESSEIGDTQEDGASGADSGTSAADIPESGAQEDGGSVYGDYNPEEDEVVDENASDSTEAGVGDEPDEGLGEYDPEQDELVEDGQSESGEPADAEPAVEYAQSDPDQLEEPEHDADAAQNASEDDQNAGDDDDDNY